MSTPAAKRRRIEASQALSKPFRSPFKTPFKSPVKARDNISPPAQGGSTPLPKKPNNILSGKLPALSAASTTPTRIPRTKKTLSTPISTATSNADPDIAPLIRAQRELEKQLREVKEDLDIAEQARKIELASRKNDTDRAVDGELVGLIEKWTNASQQAADELFGKVRDRVNRMGGPRAWKEMQKKQQEFQGGWDQVEQTKDDSDDENADKDVEKRDLYAEYDIDPETENEKSQRPKGLGDTGERPGEEDEFTMAMMLRTLNVDLDLIRYDREQQRWAD